MKLNWLLLVALLRREAAAFAPPLHFTSTGGGTTRTTQKQRAKTSTTIRHAGGMEDFISEQVSSLSGAISLAITVPPGLQRVTTELSQALIQAMPDGVDQQSVKELFDAAVTPYHLAAIGVFALASSFMLFINTPDDYSDAPFEPGTNTYDPAASQEFYRQRPLMVLRRILKLAVLTGSFNTGILIDWLVLGKLFKDEEYTALKRNEPRRAKQALILCEQLGPTFIKLGQALSIRTDLIPEAYALSLRQLQDAVPPFSSEQAYDILRKEFRVDDLSRVFLSLSDKPVASASIGQVYRGVLAANGKEVAVKVQRPGILAEIALDLYILRLLSPIQTIFQNAANGIKTDQADIDLAIALVDEWGRGFVAETDYRLEADNTRTFEAAMRKRGLDAVCAPTVVGELTRDKVLVTEWVTGTRLDRDASPDVPRLCGVAINAYLTMLLDTGVLHCDPHPGNLLRTTDGRLCILDFGMTLELPNDLQYALLEFIAHINVEDYDAIPQDFINLGFSPEGVTAERLKNSGITEGLSFAFRQLSGGGGPKRIQERVKAEFQERYGADLSDEDLRKAARAEMLKRMEEQLASEGVDVKGVTNVMEEMSRRNRELFQLPPYVLYVARAFSTLEGIGLSIDENYAIVQECYPYLAQRLFTDRSPRAKRALKAMLGLNEEEHNQVQSSLAFVQAGAGTARKRKGLSPAKLIEMTEGFNSYTAATANVDRDGKGQIAAAAGFTKLFLDPKGSTLQDILVDEVAKLGDATTRATLRRALVDSPPAKLSSRFVRGPKEFLDRNAEISRLIPGPIREAFVERPVRISAALESLVALNDEDERILATAQELADVLRPQLLSAFSRNETGAIGAIPVSMPGDSDIASSSSSSLTALLADEEMRKSLQEQLPGLSALGRRVATSLLRRAAYRTEQSPAIPENVRKSLIQANTVVADRIEPKEDVVS